MAFSKRKKNDSLHFVCDLGSSSIAGSLVHINKQNTAEVLWQKRIPLNFSGNEHRPSLSVLEKELKYLIEAADIFIFKSKIKNVPRSVLISVSSPWYISRLKKEKVSKADPFNVTPEHINEIITNAGKSLRAEILRERGPQSTFFESGSVVIEQQIAELRVNGYNIKNPINVKAREIALSLMISVIPQELYKFLNAAFDAFWSNIDFSISSFPYTHFNTLEFLDLNDQSTVLIDVSGFETELTLVEKGALQNITYVHVGKNHFNQKIVKELDITPFMAESEFKLMVEGGSTIKQEANLSLILSSVEEKWKKEIGVVINQNENLAFKKYILSVDPGFYSYFESLLVQFFRSKGIEDKISINQALYDNQEIKYLSNTRRDTYLEIIILSLLNSK